MRKPLTIFTLAVLFLFTLPLQGLPHWKQYVHNEMPTYLQSFKDTVERQAQDFPGIFYLSGNPETKRVALTFDDGPDEHYTPAILDILQEYGVKATFFVLGQQVQRFPHITLEIHEAGHTIGNHSYSHPDFRKLSCEEIIEEITSTDQLLQELHISSHPYLRPPYGAIRDETITYLGAKDWVIVNWSLDTFDWDTDHTSPEAILDHVQAYSHPGAIILLHNAGGNRSATVEALPNLITYLQEQGYELITIDSLLNPQ